MKPSANHRGPLLPRIVRTLLTSGYVIDRSNRPTDGAVILNVRRVDSLGGEARSVLLFTVAAGSALLLRLQSEATIYGGIPTIVSRSGRLSLQPTIRQLSEADFFAVLGGEVLTDRIFVSELPTVMDALGHRRRPRGLTGKAEKLLEGFTQDAFSYLLESPIRRYGHERSFEKVPDALILARNRFNICLDTKSYSGSYHPSASDMRAFREYVEDFNTRYAEYVGAINVFIVVSGSFKRSPKALHDRSNQLLAETKTPLVFMTARDLALAISLVRQHSQARGALNWRNILLPPLFDLNKLKSEIRRIKKDAII